jgi:hypothetical protein
MAEDLFKQKKTQRNLIIILLVVLVITLLVVFQGLFKKEEKPSTENIYVEKPEIKIDFSVFDNPIFDILLPFYEIEPIEEESTSTSPGEATSVGRENPFLPY